MKKPNESSESTVIKRVNCTEVCATACKHCKERCLRTCTVAKQAGAGSCKQITDGCCDECKDDCMTICDLNTHS